MKFSVVVPVYNSEAFLHKCINSIISQSYEDYELILIDDGSTDSSRKICEYYQQSYKNICLICQDNSGPSVARNHGIEVAGGDYITFVDSDDWVKPGYFRKLEEIVRNRPDLVFFGTGHFDGIGEVSKVFPKADLIGHDQVVNFIADNYSHGDICSVVNKVFSKELLKKANVRFPEGTVVEEDLQFVLMAADKANHLLSIEDVLYCYNRREFGSVTTKYNPTKFDSKIMAYREELHIAEKWEQEKLKAIFHDNYLSYISSCINNLMYEACTLTTREKLAEIRRFFLSNETKICIASSKGVTLRSKVMGILIRLRLYKLSYWIHYFTFHVRRR